MKQKWFLMTGTALALAAALAGCGAAAPAADQTQTRQPSYISMAQAQTAALDDASIDAANADISSATLSEVVGVTCYKVEFTSGDHAYDYSINAETGEVVEMSVRDEAAPADAPQADAPVSGTTTAPASGTTTAPVSGTSHAASASVQAAPNKNASAEGSGKTTAPATQPSGTAKQITESAAKDAALKHAGVKRADATFVKTKQDWEDGRLVYEIEFVVPSGSSYKEYDYEIDAYTAAVISYDYDIEASYTLPASGSGTGSSATVTETSAKKTALAQVPGATEANIIKFKLDMDDGRWEYEGEIVYNNMEYDFTIDANTGSIIEWDVESVYD